MRREDRRVVWVAGWGMHRAAWGRLPSRLPGTPLFVTPDGPTPDSLADAVLAELTPGCLAIGWSLGGQLLLRAACERPPAGLVLIGVSTRFTAADPALGWPDRILQRMRRRLAADPDGVLKDFAAGLWSAAEREAGEPERFPPPGGWSPGALAAGLEMLATADLRAACGQLAIPVLWFHGADDPICPVGGFRQTRSALAARPNHTFVELPGAGHAPGWTRPDLVAQRIAQWMPSSTNAS